VIFYQYVSRWELIDIWGLASSPCLAVQLHPVNVAVTVLPQTS